MAEPLELSPGASFDNAATHLGIYRKFVRAVELAERGESTGVTVDGVLVAVIAPVSSPSSSVHFKGGRPFESK